MGIRNVYHINVQYNKVKVIVTLFSCFRDFALYFEDYFITLTYISWSSDFALYLEYYFMYEHRYLRLCISILKINVGHCELYFMVQ